MAGNAHRTRPRSKPCGSDCIFCRVRPSQGDYHNRNGHRHNPTHKRRGKRGRK